MLPASTGIGSLESRNRRPCGEGQRLGMSFAGHPDNSETRASAQRIILTHLGGELVDSFLGLSISSISPSACGEVRP